MLLVIDVGNTNTVLGLYRGKKLVELYRIETIHHRTADEYAVALNQLFALRKIGFEDIADAAIASVVPPVVPGLVMFCQKYLDCKPLIVGPGIKTGVSILYDNPREVGADRIANAVAGYELYGGPLIVVDFGTATTFDAITAKGEYLGGVIAPGLDSSIETLTSRTAQLPKIEFVKPKAGVIGKNTIDAMLAGAYYGYLGLIDRIVAEMKSYLAKKYDAKNVRVVATGGLGSILTAESGTIEETNDSLTLEGIRLIHSRNTRGIAP